MKMMKDELFEVVGPQDGGVIRREDEDHEDVLSSPSLKEGDSSSCNGDPTTIQHAGDTPANYTEAKIFERKERKRGVFSQVYGFIRTEVGQAISHSESADLAAQIADRYCRAHPDVLDSSLLDILAVTEFAQGEIQRILNNPMPKAKKHR